MVNKNSFGFWLGKVCGKVAFITVGILIGRCFRQKPIDQGFPIRDTNEPEN
jgi:hypothetical protein